MYAHYHATTLSTLCLCYTKIQTYIYIYIYIYTLIKKCQIYQGCSHFCITRMELELDRINKAILLHQKISNTQTKAKFSLK